MLVCWKMLIVQAASCPSCRQLLGGCAKELTLTLPILDVGSPGSAPTLIPTSPFLHTQISLVPGLVPGGRTEPNACGNSAPSTVPSPWSLWLRADEPFTGKSQRKPLYSWIPLPDMDPEPARPYRSGSTLQLVPFKQRGPVPCSPTATEPPSLWPHRD